MGAKKRVKSSPIVVYALQNKLMNAVTIELKAGAFKKIYWVARNDTTIRDALTKLFQNPMESLLVVNKKGKVIGALTTNTKAAKKCKKKPKGPGSPGPKGPARCKQECEEACQDRGGCGLVIADQWGHCMWECNDKLGGALGPEFDQTLDALF